MKQQKQMMRQMDERLKLSNHENYELRLKVNQLLTERQAQLVKLERYRVTEWDWMRQYDMERKKRKDSEIKLIDAERK